jgi:AraC-like DNA-binding protein
MSKRPAEGTPNMAVWQGGGFNFVRFDLAHGTSVDIDKIFHDSIVLLSFEGCRWTTRSGGESRIEAPGSIVLRDAGQVFSIKAEEIDVTGGTCREIHFSPARLAEIYGTFDNPLPEFEFSRSLLDNPAMAQALIRTHRLYEVGACQVEASEALTKLLQQVACQTSNAPLKRTNRVCSKRNAKIIEYMRAHYDQSLSLPELASLVEMNPFVLLRQFQKEMGISPHEYLQIHRVNQAKRHIIRGERLVDVAQICGFADQSHLNRQFRRRTGLTPGNYAARRGDMPAARCA